MRRTKEFEAYLDDYGVIVVYLKQSFYQGYSDAFFLTDNESETLECKITSRELASNEYTKYILEIPGTLTIGKEYEVIEEHAKRTVLQYGMIVKTKKFDQAFYYDNNDLGANYHREFTEFVLWAPTASQVMVHVENGTVSVQWLNRESKGIFRGIINGDLDGLKYVYHVKVNGTWREVVDPYAKSLNTNGKMGVIINPQRLKTIPSVKVSPSIINMSDHIIYELSIRDFTSSPTSNSSFPMQYRGVYEPGRSYQQYATGIDYLSKLGVTMVQLMPVHDFATVDEVNVEKYYNWGYDPHHFMALEGSYSSNPKDGYSRILEFRQLVAELHNRGMYVSIDLVYNHVYDMQSNSLELVVPNYYFRMNEVGNISNGSFCGNDYESRALMARKYLVDCCRNWINLYDLDGFRFDLMGIIDIKTSNMIVEAARQLKPEFKVYGEGWNMPTMLSEGEKTTIENASLTPGIAFFNDRFRDVVKGSTDYHQRGAKGYASGDLSKVALMKNVLSGSVIGFGQGTYFIDPQQSINYVECHDNQTLWDKLKECCKEDTREQRIDRVKLIMTVLMISQGVPFIHAGQEFCRTKNQDHNSYRSSDEINKIDFQRRINYQEVVDYTIDMIKLRKMFPHFRLNDMQHISQAVSFEEDYHGLLIYRINYQQQVIECLINVTNHVIIHQYPLAVRLIANEAGLLTERMDMQIVTVNPRTVTIVVK